MIWISIILSLAVPGTLLVGYLNRRGNPNDKAKGIGWQFIVSGGYAPLSW